MTTAAEPGRAAPRRRPLFVLLLAHYLSSFGNAITVITVPLYVLHATGSSVSTGLAGFANTLPLIFAGAVGGVWIDRVGGKRMSVLCDIVAGVSIGLVPLLDDTVGLPLPVLMGLLFGRSLGSTPTGAARQSLIKPLAEQGGVRLASANAWMQGAPRLGLLVGAPLAGLLVAVSGPVTGMYVDSASFMLCLLVAVGVPHGPGHTSAGQPREGFLRQLAEGAKLVRGIPVVGAMTAFVFVTNFLDDAFNPVILPVYSDQVLEQRPVPGLAGGRLRLRRRRRHVRVRPRQRPLAHQPPLDPARLLPGHRRPRPTLADAGRGAEHRDLLPARPGRPAVTRRCPR